MPDRLTAIAAILAVFISLFALWYSRRSAKAAEDAADQTRRTADSEAEHVHLAYEPKRQGRFVVRDGVLFYEFTLQHDFVWQARVEQRGGAWSNDLIPETRSSDDTCVVRITHVADDSWPLLEDKVIVRFWPPAGQDGQLPSVSCRCRRSQVADDGRGHWRWEFGLPQSAKQVPVEPVVP